VETVVEQRFTKAEYIEKERARVMKAPARVIAKKFLHMPRALHLQCIHCKIHILNEGSDEELPIHRQDERKENQSRNEDDRVFLQVIAEVRPTLRAKRLDQACMRPCASPPAIAIHRRSRRLPFESRGTARDGAHELLIWLQTISKDKTQGAEMCAISRNAHVNST